MEGEVAHDGNIGNVGGNVEHSYTMKMNKNVEGRTKLSEKLVTI